MLAQKQKERRVRWRHQHKEDCSRRVRAGCKPEGGVLRCKLLSTVLSTRYIVSTRTIKSRPQSLDAVFQSHLASPKCSLCFSTVEPPLLCFKVSSMLQRIPHIPGKLELLLRSAYFPHMPGDISWTISVISSCGTILEKTLIRIAHAFICTCLDAIEQRRYLYI